MTACRRCEFTAPDLAEHATETGHWLCPCCSRSLTDADPVHGCERCLEQAGADLALVALLFDELPRHLGHLHGSLGGVGSNDGHPLPGGTILALLSEGSEGLAEDDFTTKDGDPPSISYELGWWALAVMDDRRENVEMGHRPQIVVRRATRYLTTHLRWAAVTFPGFPDLSRDLRRWVRVIEAATGRTEPREVAGVPCLSCGGDLVQEITDRGRADHWTCQRCGDVLSDGQYWLAVRAGYESAQEWMPISEAARRAGVTVDQVKKWAARGGKNAVGVSCRVEDGRTLVRWPDVKERAS